MSNYTQEELDLALRQCETELLHQMGQIQPHGALLIINSDSRRTVLQASDNLQDFIDLPVDGVTGKPLAELPAIVDAGQIEQLIQDANELGSATGSATFLPVEI